MNKYKAILYISSITFSVILILYAINVFPIPGTDSIVFIPSALLYSKGFGLANPLYYVTKFTDLTHTNRFNYYPPFYPYVLGLLSKIKPGMKTIFVICSLVSMANLLLFARVMSSSLPDRLSGFLKAMVFLSIPYIATYLLPTVGRPECFTSLFVFIVYILYSKRNEYNAGLYNILICTLFSWILTTQMVSFYFCFLFFISYELLNSTTIYKTILSNTLRLIMIVLLCCLILAITPNGLVNTITGIKLHIAYVLDRSDRSIPLFIHYWLLAPLNFGFIIVFLLCAGFYVREVFARCKNMPVMQVVLVAGVQGFIVLGIVKFILYASPTVYNATGFILPLSVYLILNITRQVNSTSKKVASAFTIATYLAGTVVFLRSLVLFTDYLADGKVYATAKTQVKAILQNNKNVYVTQGLWPLFENMEDVKIYNKSDLKTGDIVIVQQAYHPFPPELVNKCTVMYDWSTVEQRKFLGITLTNRPQGYSFVVCKIN